MCVWSLQNIEIGLRNQQNLNWNLNQNYSKFNQFVSFCWIGTNLEIIVCIVIPKYRKIHRATLE